MSGDIPEQEYKSTREEYRNQLQTNLRSIDEIRSLLMVMSQLEMRPGTTNSTGQGGMSSRPTPTDSPDYYSRARFRTIACSDLTSPIRCNTWTNVVAYYHDSL